MANHAYQDSLRPFLVFGSPRVRTLTKVTFKAAFLSPSVAPSSVGCHSHDSRVHCLRMKNITLSADEQLIEQARLLAKSRHKTLNAVFREWLEQFTAQGGNAQEFDALMKRLKHVHAGRRFSRDEMNER